MLLGAEPGNALEDGGEILAGGEAECVGDVGDAHHVLGEHLLSLFDTTTCDVVQRGAAHLFLETIAEGGLAHIGSLGHVRDGMRVGEVLVDVTNRSLNVGRDARRLSYILRAPRFALSGDGCEQHMQC